MTRPALAGRHLRPVPIRLGDVVSAQLRRLCGVTGIAADAYQGLLKELMGPVARRPLSCPPPSASFISDDHTPVEFSLAFLPRAAPALRVLLEPGCGGRDLTENGDIGRRAVGRLADRWGFSTERLRRIEDVFFPAAPYGPLALWIALELRPDGRPGVKVYLNPAAHGPEHAAEAVAEALARLGYRDVFAVLRRRAARRGRDADRFSFLALDLGDWAAPRVKVYVTHRDLSAGEAGAAARVTPGGHPEDVQEFFRLAGGRARLDGRPALSCYSLTEQAADRPGGYTLHVPVRAYARDDQEARDRAVAVLRRHGMDGTVLDRALAALTPRALSSGVGLIAYLALVHERDRPARVTAYLSAEAYRVQPPRAVGSEPGRPGGTATSTAEPTAGPRHRRTTERKARHRGAVSDQGRRTHPRHDAAGT